MTSFVRNWCVGLYFGDGTHDFRVFDDYEEAARFERITKSAGVYRGVPVSNIKLWEM